MQYAVFIICWVLKVVKMKVSFWVAPIEAHEVWSLTKDDLLNAINRNDGEMKEKNGK